MQIQTLTIFYEHNTNHKHSLIMHQSGTQLCVDLGVSSAGGIFDWDIECKFAAKIT